jgi:hypothetical protein
MSLTNAWFAGSSYDLIAEATVSDDRGRSLIDSQRQRQRPQRHPPEWSASKHETVAEHSEGYRLNLLEPVGATDLHNLRRTRQSSSDDVLNRVSSLRQRQDVTFDLPSPAMRFRALSFSVSSPM